MKKLLLATAVAIAVTTATGLADPNLARPSATLGPACAMMALSIEAIATEHFNYPSEPRDELVARFVAEALASPSSAGQSPERLIEIAGKFVDYVEDHHPLGQDAIQKLKRQFLADCTSFRLPW